jgi:hypothetical protein
MSSAGLLNTRLPGAISAQPSPHLTWRGPFGKAWRGGSTKQNRDGGSLIHQAFLTGTL